MRWCQYTCQLVNARLAGLWSFIARQNEWVPESMWSGRSWKNYWPTLTGKDFLWMCKGGMDVVTALMVKPGEQPCVVSLVDDTDFLNAAVSVGAMLMCTAAVLPIEKDVVAIYAWDGIMSGLKGNRKIGKRIIAGTFYIVRIVGDELRSLTNDDVEKYCYRFWKIRSYDDQEVMDSWLDDLWLAD